MILDKDGYSLRRAIGFEPKLIRVLAAKPECFECDAIGYSSFEVETSEETEDNSVEPERK